MQTFEVREQVYDINDDNNYNAILSKIFIKKKKQFERIKQST